MKRFHHGMMTASLFCLLTTVSLGAEVNAVEDANLSKKPIVNTAYTDPAAVFTNEQTPLAQSVPQQSSIAQSSFRPNSCPSDSCCQQPCYNCCERSPFESDHCFDGFIEPVTNFVNAIDPRSRTRARGVFLNQMIPDTSIIGDGDLQLYAMQVSVALTERLAFIAEKDGYVNIQTKFIDRSGWADVAAGLKYVLVRDVENQTLLTAGFMYEVPIGSGAVFQGNGDGIWTMFLTGGQEFADGNAHVMGTVGYHLPNNKSKETESLYYSLHLDYQVFQGWYALWEFNGIYYTDSGNMLASPQEGGDLINLGANNVDGNHVATTALGVTRVFNRHLSSAVAYEVPVTNRKDLFDNRLTATITLTY